MKAHLSFLVVSIILLPLILLSGCNDKNPEPEIPTLAEKVSAQLEKNSYIGSYSFFKEGQVIVEGGVGFANKEAALENTESTKFRIGSVTKQFTSSAILQLEEQAMLSIEDNIADYLPDYPNGDMITIRHLLQHTSGIPDFLGLPGFDEKRNLKIDDVINFFKDEPLLFTPGEEFNYSNSGYILLGKIIETLSETTYAEYMQENIFQPAGLQNTEYSHDVLGVNNRAIGYLDDSYEVAPATKMSIPHAAGAIASTVQDLQLWSKALDNNLLLSANSKEKMFEANQYGFGLGWVEGSLDQHKAVFHHGAISGFRSLFVKVETLDLTIVLLSNKDHSNLNGYFNQIWDIIQEYDEEKDPG